jgi:alkylhydroperoxidase family enzyme
LRNLGVSEDAIAALDDPENAMWSPRERAALLYAEQVTRDAKEVSDEMFAELKKHFDEGQIIELTAAIGLFNFFNRFNDALLIEPTAPGWVGGLAEP